MDTEIEIEKDNIIMTTKTAEFLLSKNPDSLSLYVFYIKNAKIQKTNKIWNTDTFGMNGLGWGKKRYTDAKKVLLDSGLLKIIPSRDAKGKLLKTYIKLNYIHKYQNPQVDEPTGSNQEPNALSNKSEMLKVIKKEMLVSNETTEASGLVKPNQDEQTETLVSKETLPSRLGGTPIARVADVYKRLFHESFKSDARIGNHAKFNSIIKGLLKDNTERQMAVVLHKFFNWYGKSGEDHFEHKKLVEKGFPIDFLPRMMDIVIAHLTEECTTVYNDPNDILTYIRKNLLKLLQ